MNKRKSRGWFLLGAIVLSWAFCLWSAEKSVLDRFSPEQKQKLLAGEAVYEGKLTTGPDQSTKGIGAATVLINAPIDQCFKMFLEFDKQPLYFPRMTVSKVLSVAGNTTLIYKELDYRVMTIRYTHILTTDPADHRVDFVTDPKGVNDIKLSRGFFRFEQVDDGKTLFIYGMVELDAGIKIPEFIQTYISSKDLPVMALNLKKWIESRGKWRK